MRGALVKVPQKPVKFRARVLVVIATVSAPAAILKPGALIPAKEPALMVRVPVDPE